MARDPASKNAFENSRGGGWSPKSGKQNPPPAGSQAPKQSSTNRGGYGAGGSAVHPSLRKSK